MYGLKFTMILMVLLSGRSFAQENDGGPFLTSVRASAGPVLSVGDKGQMFRMGGGGSFAVQHRLDRLPFLNFYAGAGFEGIPLLDRSSSVLFADLSVGAGLEFEIAPRFVFEGLVSAGAYAGVLLDPSNTGFGGLFSAGVLLGYDVTGPLRLGLGASYRSYFGLDDQIRIDAAAAYRFDFHLEDSFRSADFVPEPFYPELIGCYAAGMPLGRVVLANAGEAPWKKMSVRFDVPGISRGWTAVPADPGLAAGDALDLALLGDFDPKNRIGEAGEAVTRVSVDYRYKGWPQERELEGPVDVRRAPFADNPASAALFVASKDPVIRDWALAAMDRGIEVTEELNPVLSAAAAVYESLSLGGYRMAEDGEDSWRRLLRPDPDPGAFPFPRAALLAGSGDRTESAVLFAALLEAAGFPSGLVLKDGAFWPAAALGEGAARIEADYSRPEDLVAFDGVGWAVFDPAVPDGILASLASGAAAMRAPGEPPVLVDVRRSWEAFPQAGFSRDPVDAAPLDAGALTERYAAAVDALVRWEIAARKAALERRIAARPDDVDALDSLGVLLARYGLREESTAWFDKVLLLEDDPRALVNMANVEFLKGDLTRARTYYNQAYRVDPFNPYVLLGLSRVDFEQENFGSSRDAYSKLEIVDPDLAERFSVLTGTGPDALEAARKSDLRRVVFWLE